MPMVVQPHQRKDKPNCGRTASQSRQQSMPRNRRHRSIAARQWRDSRYSSVKAPPLHAALQASMHRKTDFTVKSVATTPIAPVFGPHGCDVSNIHPPPILARHLDYPRPPNPSQGWGQSSTYPTWLSVPEPKEICSEKPRFPCQPQQQTPKSAISAPYQLN